VGGKSYEVEPSKWRGARDRSWGIRPVGEPEAPGIRVEDVVAAKVGFYHNWIPLHLDRGMYKVMYDADYAGATTVQEAAFVPAYGQPGEIQHFGEPKIEIDYISGTREMKEARTILPNPNGDDIHIRSIPQRTVYLAAGTGYMPRDGWGHGFYQGKNVVQGMTFDMSTQAKRTEYAVLNETLCRLELGTGEVSYGMHENMLIGIYKPFGFETPSTMAP
jgi:hypothetical protein